jgi:hypothetical protein
MANTARTGFEPGAGMLTNGSPGLQGITLLDGGCAIYGIDERSTVNTGRQRVGVPGEVRAGRQP